MLLHEVGHAVNVIRRQDRSEEAAYAYLDERIAESVGAPDANGDIELGPRHRPGPPAAPASSAGPPPAGSAPVADARSGGSAVLGVGAALAVLALALLAL